MMGQTRIARTIGAFVLYYLILMIASLWGALLAGVNPTMILSIVSAPYWILVILITIQLTKRVG